MNQEKVVMTTSSGNPIDNNQNSMTAGPQGPILLQDFTLIDKLAHFDRERIPERVVHAKGAGAHGVFEVTNDVTGITKANFLNTVGKKTPVFLRFSTVAGESGAPDTQRDPRGFAIKFYTEEGNYDMVGNNTPVFFINDPIKFPDFIHSQKRNPATNLTDPNTIFDFWQHSPEALHQIMILFSDRGTPYGYRHMNGYGSHTFKWVNKEGKVHYVKYHFKTDQGIKNFTAGENDKMTIKEKDFSTKDLYDEIQKGNYPSWKFYVQVMPEEDASNYRFDVFDITKIWPHSDYPLQMVGKLTLNQNPTNYFAEVEQSAFSPSHLVPGIEPSADKMLQGRLFSYPDTQRHRLGKNYDQIPINCPYRARVASYSRDGVSTVLGNNGGDVNYEPNSVNGPVEDAQYAWSQATLEGKCGRFKIGHKNTPYEQPRELWNKVFTDQDRTNFVSNISGPLSGARPEIQKGMLRLFWKVDPDYGTRIAQAIGCDLPADCKLSDGQKMGENQNKKAKAASHMAVGVDQTKVQAGNQVDKATATVGWIGCGIMGRHQVMHIIKNGYKVFVWNRTKAKADEAVAAGATWCETPADLAKACNYIFMMVGYPKDVEQMAFCPKTGLYSGLQENTFLIDHTTSSPALAKRMATELKEQKKVTVIDAPVSGGDIGAKAGKLVVMAGGEETAFNHIKPLMETYGQKVMYMGAAGQGQNTKCANQIMISTNMVGLCEALIFGHSAGLPLDNMIELLEGGAAGSHALKNLGPKMLKRDMDPGFLVKHLVKDLGLALDEARDMGLSLPGTALASQLYMSLKAQGGEEMGTQGLLLALEKMNNMSVTKYTLENKAEQKMSPSSTQRKMIIGGNWKCNGTLKSVKDLVSNVLNKSTVDHSKLEVVVCPISLHLEYVKDILNKSIKVGCQDISAAGKGAFTGEISGDQLKDFGLDWVVIGHSERRSLFGEDQATVAAKVAQAQKFGLSSLVCVGEQLTERENGTTNNVLKVQLDAIKSSVKDWSTIVIAYEPVWAIGTGKVASPEQAQETHEYIRSWFADNISKEVSNAIRIQYGGSVNAKNAAALISQKDIDGFLVGGASLKPDFLDIIKSCNDHKQ